MKQKTIKSIAELPPPKPGTTQMIPLNLWDVYRQRYGLRVIRQDWDTRRGCPVVYTQTGVEPR
jgi:hypothetical protein